MKNLTDEEIAEGCVMSADGIKRWYDENRHYHRLGGPAILGLNGNQLWYKHGRRHCLCGPAVDVDWNKEWWVEGEKIECSSQEEFEQILKLKAFW
jgi:hypothetical protein